MTEEVRTALACSEAEEGDEDIEAEGVDNVADTTKEGP